MKNRDIIVIFTPEGLMLDVQETAGKAYTNDALLADFKAAPHKALFYFGFGERHSDMSQSLSFLHGVCRTFLDALSRDPDVEVTKTAPEPDPGLFAELLRGVPYAVGAEYIDPDWLARLWTELSAVFEREIAAWGSAQSLVEGSVASFLNTHNAGLNVAGRVFFHLVENKSDDYPFAFLATYSTAPTGTSGGRRADHLPLYELIDIAFGSGVVFGVFGKEYFQPC